jgi:hypothetical protein
VFLEQRVAALPCRRSGEGRLYPPEAAPRSPGAAVACVAEGLSQLPKMCGLFSCFTPASPARKERASTSTTSTGRDFSPPPPQATILPLDSDFRPQHQQRTSSLPHHSRQTPPSQVGGASLRQPQPQQHHLGHQEEAAAGSSAAMPVTKARVAKRNNTPTKPSKSSAKSRVAGYASEHCHPTSTLAKPQHQSELGCDAESSPVQPSCYKTFFPSFIWIILRLVRCFKIPMQTSHSRFFPPRRYFNSGVTPAGGSSSTEAKLDKFFDELRSESVHSTNLLPQELG